MHKYILTMEPVPEDVGYWPNGITHLTSGNASMKEGQEAGWHGDAKVLGEERRTFIQNLESEGVPLIVVPYPEPKWLNAWGIGFDVEYVRDPMIMSRASKELLLFNMGERTRQNERIFHARLFRTLGISVINDSDDQHNEGGNIRQYDIEGERWVFAATSVRSNLAGVTNTADFLGIEEKHRVILALRQGFHLDCSITGVITHNEGHIFTVMDAFTDDARRQIERVVKDLGLELHPLDPQPETNLATNQLTFCSNGHLSVFSSEPFAKPEAREALHTIEGVVVQESPLSQNSVTGGADHCLTQEIWTSLPLNPETANKNLAKDMGEVFPPGSKIKILNNY